MTFNEEMRRAIKDNGVWQVTPPSDYKDRMAEEGAPATPQGGYPLTDHGGSTIPNPKLVLVYMGPFWGDKTQLEKFANDLMTAGFLDPLTAYGSGPGTFAGAFVGPTLSGTVSDAQCQAALQSALGSTAGLPQPDGHTLYAMIMPQGVTVTQGGQSSCQAFCGYHSNMGSNIFYSVQTYSGCQGCNLGDIFGAFTAVIAHEVAEACTDAVPGLGWYNDQTGMENSDEWAWVFGPYGPWTIQGYQVNGTGNSLSLIKYNPQSQPPPPTIKSLAIAGPSGGVVGTSLSFSATLTPADASAHYAWQANGMPVGTDSPSFTLAASTAGTVKVNCTAQSGSDSVVAPTFTVTITNPQPQPCRAQADAGFAAALGAIAADHQGVWDTYGQIWVTWAQGVVDGSLSASAMPVIPDSPSQSFMDRLKELLGFND